ncbi:MAG: P-loop NTPase fold protein [Pseudonocardiales bacterium]
MKRDGNRFSPQLPVGFEDAIALYGPHREFRAGLESIADHIAHEGEPMTFALYGAWGTGKSTALEYLKGLIRQRNDKVTFSQYEAPLWARYPDERSTLALQILRGAGQGMPATVATMLGGFLKYDKRALGGQSQPDDYDLATSLALLDVLASVPHAPPVIEEWIRRHITRSGSIRHVVMLDDLDRCDLDFAARLLKATSHWTTGNDHSTAAGYQKHRASIYFVLACREDFLVASQGHEETKEPQQWLEKYVHVAITVPKLLRRPTDAAAYLSGLVRRLTGLPEAARERLAAMIHESGQIYPNGLFAPLVRIMDANLSTPRAVKTRLNLALTEIDPERLDDEALVKEWIIKAFWPDFWSNQYRELLTQDDHPLAAAEAELRATQGVYDRIEPIHIVGARLKGLVGMSDDALSEALTHIGGEARADLADVTPQLAIYLASDPLWPSRGGTGGAAPDDLKAQMTDDSEPGKQWPRADPLPRGKRPADAAQMDEALGALPDAELPNDPDDQILFFYLAADSAEDRGDRLSVEQALTQLLAVARQRGPETRHGATIGNAALIADRAGLAAMAFELHRLARLAEPEHFNIMQNYINFVLEEEIADEYPEAQRLYKVLVSAGKDHRPFRTLILGIRLDAVTRDSVPDRAERIERVLAMLAEEPSTARLFEIVKIGPDILGYDALRAATRVVAERATDDRSRNAALRLLATGLGGSNNPVHEREVVDLERWSISVGLSCAVGNEIYATSLYSLALQLGSLGGYRRAATLVYAEAYRLNPTDADYRRSLASSLERMGRNDDATAVLLGRPIDIDDVQPEDLPLLLSELDQTDRWWERLPVTRTGPCPTKLGWLIPQRSRSDDEDHSGSAS